MKGSSTRREMGLVEEGEAGGDCSLNLNLKRHLYDLLLCPPTKEDNYLEIKIRDSADSLS